MTNASDEAGEKLPTVLIVTDYPDIYQALRVGLGLAHEVKSSTGASFDVGLVTAANDTWQVFLPVEPKLLEGVAIPGSDRPPSLVILIDIEVDIAEHAGDGAVLVPSAVIVASNRQSGAASSVPAPKAVVSLLERVRMRGKWPRPIGQSSDYVVGGPRELASAALWRAARDASFLHCPCLSICVGFSFGISDAEFVEALLRNLDPADLSSASPTRSNAAPPVMSLPGQHIEIHGTITSIEMSSLRMLSHLDWQASAERAGWQVILGDNASGKTSLLRALALCLLDRSDRDALRQGWNTWLRHGADEGSVHVDLTDDDTTPHSLRFDLRRLHSKDPLSTTVDIQSSERVRYAGFLAAYGPFRRFTGGDPDWIKDFRNHPRLQSVLTLFDERAALSDALEWLKDLWVRARTQQPTPPEAAFLPELLAFINETGFLPEGVVILEPDADGVWCRDGNGQRVPATELSDGYRAVFSLVLDLLRRLSVAYGYDKIFADTPARHIALGGIVLIDEVDAHLHPRWQQRIGLWFKEHFPRMQFIVATHSPIVCQAADSVMLLPTPGEGTEARMATPEELNRLRYGDLLDAFSTDFFGERVTRSQAGRDKLDRLAELNDEMITRELTADEQTEQATLRDELGTVGAAATRGDAG